jgi:hypothetical protein
MKHKVAKVSTKVSTKVAKPEKPVHIPEWYCGVCRKLTPNDQGVWTEPNGLFVCEACLRKAAPKAQ